MECCDVLIDILSGFLTDFFLAVAVVTFLRMSKCMHIPLSTSRRISVKALISTCRLTLLFFRDMTRYGGPGTIKKAC